MGSLQSELGKLIMAGALAATPASAAAAETKTNKELDRRPRLLDPAPKIAPEEEMPFLFELKFLFDMMEAGEKSRREREGEPLPPGVY